MSQSEQLMEILKNGNLAPIPKPHPAFVKLGSRYIRPGDVVSFEQGAFSGWTRLRMTDGNEWNVQLRPSEVASVLGAS